MGMGRGGAPTTATTKGATWSCQRSAQQVRQGGLTRPHVPSIIRAASFAPGTRTSVARSRRVLACTSDFAGKGDRGADGEEGIQARVMDAGPPPPAARWYHDQNCRLTLLGYGARLGAHFRVLQMRRAFPYRSARQGEKQCGTQRDVDFLRSPPPFPQGCAHLFIS